MAPQVAPSNVQNMREGKLLSKNQLRLLDDGQCFQGRFVADE